MEENIKFSVLMSIYFKERPEFFIRSMDSILNQTVLPSEIVLVEDGKLTKELEDIILDYEKKYDILKVIRFDLNRGLGYALNDGLRECKYNYVFRMDTDDICKNNRFERQIEYLKDHPDIDVLGTNILEFQNDITEDMRVKKMPVGSYIDEYIKKRSPVNHMTVCFKKDKVLSVGSYMPLYHLEDYYLWVRMYLKGMKFENIDEELVYARIGNGFYKRRGDKEQIKAWKFLENFMKENKLINKKTYLFNMFKIYLLIYSPSFIRKIAYNLLLRR